MKQKYSPAPTVDHEVQEPKSSARFRPITEFSWGIPETERIHDDVKIEVEPITNRSKTLRQWVDRVKQLFRFDELDNLDERLEGIYKQEPSEDILVQKQELQRLRI